MGTCIHTRLVSSVGCRFIALVLGGGIRGWCTFVAVSFGFLGSEAVAGY